MGQVMKASLSCYQALLSFDNKTRQQDKHTLTAWSICFINVKNGLYY